MDYHAGIDVSLKESSVCVMDAKGKVMREAEVASDPECLIGYFSELDLMVACIGLEAGPPGRGPAPAAGCSRRVRMVASRARRQPLARKP